jgi:predicted PurR-regulated permease PerM
MNDRFGSHTITITTGTIIRGVCVVALTLGLFYIKDIVLVLLAAVVIASAVEPFARWCRRFHVGRLPAVAAVYAVCGALLASFFLFFLPSLVNETAGYISALPQNISLSDLWNPLFESTHVGSSGVLESLSSQSFSVGEIVHGLEGIVSGASGSVFKTASTLFGGALSFILIIVLSFYLAVQEDGVGDFLRIVTPFSKQEYIVNLWKRSQVKIGFWMQGQVLLGVIVGTLVYLGLFLFGVKHALLFATLAGIFELIPIFGPILSALPAVAAAFADGGASSGFLVTGLYLIIHQFENHLLYPLVVKKIVGVSPILVILSLVIGFKLAGFLGALLSVPAAAALMEYVHDIEKRNTAMRQP